MEKRVFSLFLTFVMVALLSANGFSQTPEVCPAPAERTYIDAYYTNEYNTALGGLEAQVYFIEQNEFGIGEKKPVSGGLIIIDSGNYLPGTGEYLPNSQDKNKVCKAFTDGDGNLSIKIAHPEAGMRKTHRIVFCPYVNTQGEKDLAICSRLVGENGQVQTVDYNQIPDCDSDWNAPMRSYVVVGGQSKNIWEALAPAEGSFEAINTKPAGANVAFCWALAIAFGLLLSASFTAGRNPLMFFDLNSARSVRMNRTAGHYQPMNQAVSVSIDGALNTAYSASKTIQAAGKDQVKVNAEGHVLDEKGNEIKHNGSPIVVDSAGNMKDSSGNTVKAENLSVQPAKLSSAQKMDAGYQGSRGGLAGALGQEIGAGVSNTFTKPVKGADGKPITDPSTGKVLRQNMLPEGPWSNLVKNTIDQGLTNMVMGVFGTVLAGGGPKGLGRAMGESWRSAVSMSSRTALRYAVGEAASAIMPKKDYSDSAPQGASLTPKEAHEQLLRQAAIQLGIPEDKLELETVRVWSEQRRGSVEKQRVVGKKGSEYEKARAWFGQDGSVTLVDKGGVDWSSQARVNANSQLELSNRTRIRQASQGGSGGYQMVNGILLRMGDTSEGAISAYGHFTGMVDSLYQLSFGEGRWKDVGTAIIQPFSAIYKSFGASPPKTIIENAHRELAIGNSQLRMNQDGTITTSGGRVGEFKNGNLKMEEDVGPLENGRTYRLKNGKLLDVTEENIPGIKISQDGTGFEINGKAFEVGSLSQENTQKVTSDGRTVAIIERDPDGRVTYITDENGKPIRTIEVKGVEYAIYAESAPRDEKIYVSRVGEIPIGGDSGWKGDFYKPNGERIMGDNVAQIYINDLRQRIIPGAQGEEMPSNPKVEKIRAENPEVPKGREERAEYEKTLWREIPNNNPENPLRIEDLMENAHRYKDEFRITTAELVKIEALNYADAAENTSFMLEQMKNGEFHTARNFCSKQTQEYAKEAENSIEEQAKISIEIGNVYSQAAKKIENGEEVGADLKKIDKLKARLEEAQTDSRFYSTAVQAGINIALVEKFDVGRETKDLETHMGAIEHEYRNGGDLDSAAKMSYILNGLSRVQECGSPHEAREYIEGINLELIGMISPDKRRK